MTKSGHKPDEWERRLRAVQEAGLAIAGELSLEVVLQKIVGLASSIIGCRYAALGVLDESGTGLARFLTSGMTPEEIARMPHTPRGLGLLGVLFEEEHPVRVSDIHLDPRSVGFPPNHPEMTSFLGVRIFSKGRVLGNFYLTDKMGAKEFSKDDEDLLVLFAAHAGVAIDNARLYTQTSEMLQEKIREVEHSERQARFLVEMGDILFGSPLEEAVPLRRIAQKSTEILGDAAVLILVDSNNTEMIVSRGAYHSDPARQEAAEMFASETWESLRESVLLKGEPVFVPDVSTLNSTFTVFDPKALISHKFTGALALPIGVREKVYGVCISLASQPRKFSESDFAFAILVAERVGIAIENSHLYQDVKDSLRLRDEFLSIASHELRTPITSLKGYVQILRSGRADSPELQQKALLVIERQAGRLVELVDQLLDVSRIRVGRLDVQPERMNMVEAVEEVLDRFRSQANEDEKHQFELKTASRAIWGNWDRGRMEQVLVNLVSNAIKYSPSGGTIAVGVDSSKEMVHVYVTDSGIGIPKQEQADLFDMFTRAPSVKGKGFEGMGLGLYICKQIIVRHGGKIWVESDEGHGSTFHFALPKEVPGKA